MTPQEQRNALAAEIRRVKAYTTMHGRHRTTNIAAEVLGQLESLRFAADLMRRPRRRLSVLLGHTLPQELVYKDLGLDILMQDPRLAKFGATWVQYFWMAYSDVNCARWLLVGRFSGIILWEWLNARPKDALEQVEV